MSEQSTLEEIGQRQSIDRQVARLMSRADSLPSDWGIQDAGELCTIKTGHTPSRSEEEYWDGEIPWIAIHDLTNLDTNEIHSTDEQITEEGLANSGAKILPKGTLVLCRTGSVGASAILGEEMATDQSTVSFECKSAELNPYYLMYVFEFAQPQLDRLSIGSTHDSIQLDFFPAMRIPTPDISEQREIASILYNTDQLIQKTGEVIDQCHQVRLGMMQDVFHGEHKEYDEYDSTPVGEIPSHWEVASIGEVVRTAQYGLSESLSKEGTYPVFRMNNIENGYMVEEPMKYVDLNDDEFEKYRLEKGDILFNRTNSLELVGKTGLYKLEGDHVFASYLVRLQANDRADPYYLNYYMNSQEAQNRMMDFATKGASQANINANSIQQVKAPVPPIEEQKEIAEYIRAIDRQIEQNQKYKSQLKRLKKGILDELLSGTTRTKNKDISISGKVKI